MLDQNFVYAGFWKRFLAYIIDEIIISAAAAILIIPFSILLGIGIFSSYIFEEYDHYSMVSFIQHQPFEDITTHEIFLLILLVAAFSIVIVLIQWLYHALMESSSKQGTVGKIVLNLKVVDLVGNRISFGRATGRFFGKILSGLIFNIGYIMAAFTEKKQALHDMLAGCLVIYDDPLLKLTQMYKQQGVENENIG